MLHSLFHNAWMRVVCGRMKSDYRYSGDMVYNNFIWPGLTSSSKDVSVEELVSSPVRDRIKNSARNVLSAREAHPAFSLADLYDPDKEMLFPDLTEAHRELDAAVEAAYGVDFNGDEEKIVAHLFKLYAELTDK